VNLRVCKFSCVYMYVYCICRRSGASCQSQTVCANASATAELYTEILLRNDAVVVDFADNFRMSVL